MNFMGNMILNSFSILLLAILCVHSLDRIEVKSYQHKLYIRILIITILLLVFDIFGRMDGHVGTAYPFLNHAGNFFLFLLNSVLPTIWFAFVYYQVNHSEEKTKRLTLPLIGLNIINAGVVIASQFTGWYYYIDSSNIYHRGPFYIFSSVLTVALLVVALIMIIRNREEFNRKQMFSLIFFPVAPFLGTILQICFYGIAFVINAAVLSLLIVLLNMKDDTIYTDYLTGLCNRKKIEEVLKENIKKSSQNRTFSLIMLDIDKFKEINDKYGHEMGDNALRAAAQLLKKCMRTKDYVARYGGDEFCILLEVYDINSLEAAVKRINNYADILNASKEFPFNLSFSQGYAVYDFQSRLKADEFVNQVDLLMYENKNTKNEIANQYKLQI
ncbi:MAG: diguanylate cyclase [Oscillospiraceae bacterium]|nr:diguanylate cyclase [Oscillospiraceae bacterium]